MEWKNLYRGIVIGASDVVPGVSGGTIAVLLGIYDRLIEAINGIFSKGWKNHIGFLIPLGGGMALSIFSLSRLIEWLLANHMIPTYFFFLGLIIGILPLLFNEIDVKRNFLLRHYIFLLIGVIVMTLLLFVKESTPAVITDISLSTYILLFVSGFLGSSAMILPGISGSMVLLMIGVYPTVISAISNLQINIIFVTGLGILVGFIVMSKIINYFLYRFKAATFAIIIGMVIGSIFVIFPGWPNHSITLLISVVTFAVGLFVAYILGKTEYKS